ncbi:phosphate butyryltransferase [Heyndrickxia vini]|uniref:Phosphate butyryltransferase n=1 Tax=Heyndrickxia vini TaxID=1476025 RepID=A0ABX7E6I1_9BACI|nr:phosphate butyryltransferase [Heyndrickxia vini]QQZ10910.1 phosphate butyryltransferase [Heyndrickxia vini]
MDLDTVLKRATQQNKVKVAIAAAEDYEVLEAVSFAVEKNLASFYLFGDEQKIVQLLQDHFSALLKSKDIEIIHIPTVQEAANRAVQAVSNGVAQVLMKGNLATSILLKAVLNKEFGLRTENVLSHVAVFEIPDFNRLILITDAGMNIEPDLQQKVQIIDNAVQIARSINIDMPKVAILSAVEVVNPAMKSTIDGAILTQMNQRGQIANCIVDGPLALDNAISMESAEHKGIKSNVAGAADILVVPNIETGNTFYKSLIYFAKAKVGSVIAGAKAPIVLTSRSDRAEDKLYSLALAICSAKL